MSSAELEEITRAGRSFNPISASMFEFQALVCPLACAVQPRAARCPPR